MNRRTLMQQVHDLRRELDEALTRNGVAAGHVPVSLVVAELLAIQRYASNGGTSWSSLDRMLRDRIATYESLEVAALPPEFPATPMAEGGST